MHTRTEFSSLGISALAWSVAAGFLLAGTGCGDPPESVESADSDVPILDHRGHRIEQVRSEVLSRDDIVGRPAAMAVIGPYLWVNDRKEEPFVHALDTATGAVVASLGRRGQGPEEIGGTVLNIFARPGDDNHVWIADTEDGVRRMFTSVPLPAQLQNPRALAPAGRRGAWASELGPDHFLSHDISDTARFIVFDSTGSVVRVIGVPLPGADSIPRRQRLMTAAAAFCPMPNGQRMALAYVNFGQIVLFDSAGSSRKVNVPYPSEPRFAPHPQTKALRFRAHRSYYRWCVFTDTRLYALFSGKLQGPQAWSGEGRYVHVFDLRGRLERVLDLGVEVTTIAIDRSGGRMYGASMDDAIIYRFKLPM